MNLQEAVDRVAADPDPSDEELGQILGAVTSGIVRCAAAIAAGAAWGGLSVMSGTRGGKIVEDAKRIEQYILTGE